jgi:hypothetical protein
LSSKGLARKRTVLRQARGEGSATEWRAVFHAKRQCSRLKGRALAKGQCPKLEGAGRG